MEGKEVFDDVAPRGDIVSCTSATVPVSGQSEEARMLTRERWEEIHRLHGGGQSVSAIARGLDLDRKTVRRCLCQPAWSPYWRQASASCLLDAHRPWLVERAPQVGYSARILYQELRARHGYRGGYDTVKNAVRPLRKEAALAALTQRRFETGPGEQAQVAWGQVKVRFGETVATVHVFVMTLGYSRRCWVEGFENERLASLLAAHEHAFAHFGGRTAQLLYDRMCTVVLGSEEGRTRWNPTFEAFARHWGFEPRLCKPYRAQTKGKVESGVKYVKRNFVPGRSFHDLDDFNAQLLQWLQTAADVRVHGTTHQRPIERFAEEAAALVPTASQASFLQAMVRDRVVADDWRVSIDANRYSVPCRLIGKTVQVVRAGGLWQIRYRGELVAEHPVLAGRHQLSVQPEHGPGATARNARQRYGTASAPAPQTGPQDEAVEVRDLSIYERMLEAA